MHKNLHTDGHEKQRNFLLRKSNVRIIIGIDERDEIVIIYHETFA